MIAPHRAGHGRLRVAGTALAATLIGASGLTAATAGVEVKAAFLYNFAKFTEWPAETLPPGKALTLCVVGDSGVADALEQIISGHAIDGRELTVRIVRMDAPVAGCHLLYVSAGELSRGSVVLASLKQLPILTVSDAEGFADAWGIVQLFIENNRIRFVINPKAAERARLRLSSKLLSLARIVREQP
jgi:hypothetical protein